jgi:hypothetical protein
MISEISEVSSFADLSSPLSKLLRSLALGFVHLPLLLPNCNSAPEGRGALLLSLDFNQSALRSNLEAKRLSDIKYRDLSPIVVLLPLSRPGCKNATWCTRIDTRTCMGRNPFFEVDVSDSLLARSSVHPTTLVVPACTAFSFSFIAAPSNIIFP